MRVCFSTPIWQIATIAMQTYEQGHKCSGCIVKLIESTERGTAYTCVYINISQRGKAIYMYICLKTAAILFMENVMSQVGLELAPYCTPCVCSTN